MAISTCNTSDLGGAGFAHTNRQTIAQRVALIRALLSETHSIAELAAATAPHSGNYTGPRCPA